MLPFLPSTLLQSDACHAALLGQSNINTREDPTGEDGLRLGRWDYYDNGTGAVGDTGAKTIGH